MRLVRDCLRLKSGGVSTREIARRIGVAPRSVRLIEAALTDTMPERWLFANVGEEEGYRSHEEPDRERSPRSEAQARQAVDDPGGIYRALSQRIPILTILRPLREVGEVACL
jgi:hypothetical protein